MSRQHYFDSMAGRLFLFLLVGVIGSASLALLLADARRMDDLRRINLERVVDRLQDFIALVNSAPPSLRQEMISSGIPGLRTPVGTEKSERTDVELTRLLASRIGNPARVEIADPSTCITPRPSASSFYAYVNCWIFSFQLADHSPVTLVAFSPRTDSFALSRFDAVFLSVLTIGASILAFFVARVAAAPLCDLSCAARELGGDLDRPPLRERGPFELRDAIRAFNAMQAKLRHHVVERTRILASITHDLQTPLTRLRLRLEKVDDLALRSRLIDDLAGMQALIRAGLDLCRGNQTEEPFASLALDSLLESAVEDAAESGGRVALIRRAGYDVEAQPRALQRCLANLLDNALKYGGGAEVSAAYEEGAIHIRVRDFGPGIPPDKLATVFEPFVRLETARAVVGVGLGLTIAKSLAEKNEAGLILSNHPDGGLEARLILRRGLIAAASPEDVAACA